MLGSARFPVRARTGEVVVEKRPDEMSAKVSWVQLLLERIRHWKLDTSERSGALFRSSWLAFHHQSKR
jgi:hypothetical protein